MKKIKKIIVGTNNIGKSKEISWLLPKKVKKYFPRKLNIRSPKETGKSFEKNSYIKALYFSKKTDLVCIADDSGLEVKLLKGKPGIFSSRWGGKNKNFNLAIKKVYKEMKKKNKNWQIFNSAKFICCITLLWPKGKSYTVRGTISGKISPIKKGKKGFGYDPIFVPNGYSKTFGEMHPKLKMSIDHRFKAYSKIKKFFY
tara:strand:+ start:1080 stop:1676 length:597 start_codon:yes stop_codon:yes gene_type:complete